MGKFIRRAGRAWLLAFAILSLLSWIALPCDACRSGETKAASHAAELSRASTIEAIGIDGTGVGQGFDNGGIGSITWPHTVGTGTSRLLVVGVSTTVTVLPPRPFFSMRSFAVGRAGTGSLAAAAQRHPRSGCHCSHAQRFDRLAGSRHRRSKSRFTSLAVFVAVLSYFAKQPTVPEPCPCSPRSSMSSKPPKCR